MRRCFSAPIISRVAGERCSLSLTPGQAILLAIFPIMSRAEAALLRLTSFWRGTVALGGLLIEAIGPEAPVGQSKISLVLADMGATLVTLIFGTQEYIAAAAIAFALQRLRIQS